MRLNPQTCLGGTNKGAIAAPCSLLPAPRLAFFCTIYFKFVYGTSGVRGATVPVLRIFKWSILLVWLERVLCEISKGVKARSWQHFYFPISPLPFSCFGSVSVCYPIGDFSKNCRSFTFLPEFHSNSRQRVQKVYTNVLCVYTKVCTCRLLLSFNIELQYIQV